VINKGGRGMRVRLRDNEITKTLSKSNAGRISGQLDPSA
jgi:hypothetical protein